MRYQLIDKKFNLQKWRISMTQQKKVVIGDYVEAVASSDASKVFGVVTKHDANVLLVRRLDKKSPESCQLVLEAISLKEITDSAKIHKILDIRQELGIRD